MPLLLSANFDSSEPPAGLTPPQAALWWLKKGKFRLGREWDKAHVICQRDEGELEHDMVHALAIQDTVPSAPALHLIVLISTNSFSPKKYRLAI